jgi:hypothetical protein
MVVVQSLKDSYAIDLKYLIPETNESQSVSLVVKQHQAIGEVAGRVTPHFDFVRVELYHIITVLI